MIGSDIVLLDLFINFCSNSENPCCFSAISIGGFHSSGSDAVPYVSLLGTEGSFGPDLADAVKLACHL